MAIKDAILVTLETASAVGLGESSPMAAGFGYSSDTPEWCWEDLAGSIAPSLLGRAAGSLEAIAELAAGWTASRFAIG